MLSKEQVYTQIKRSGNLPTLPEILLKLLEACDNDDVPLTEIAAIIIKDPALSFRVLQLVNSAYYGLCRNFISVEQAVAYLGANSIKNIAVSTCIHQVFAEKQFNAIKRYKISTFWWHSLMCATLARRIAKKIRYNNIDEAYLSGLLHDIGRLVLLSTFPEEHKSFLFETEDSWNELWAEEQLIGITHCEAGSWLVQNWKFNSLMADAIRYHHEPFEQIEESFPLVKIVYVANLYRQDCCDNEQNRRASDLLLGLDSNDISHIIEGAQEEVLETAKSLGINAKPPTSSGKSGKRFIYNQEDSRNTSLETDQEEAPQTGNTLQGVKTGQDLLTSKIKNIALLSGFLENLVQAGDSEAIITVFEQSMSILFGIEKVLLFLPDKDGIFLKGRTSTAGKLHSLSQGLSFRIQRSTSLITKTYTTPGFTYLTPEGTQNNLADKQLLTVLKTTSALAVPILAHKKTMGVILLGLPETIKTLPSSDCKLLQVITQQVGLCFFLEDMQARKAEEIERERRAAISMTAKKFAHEINNPLGIITNYLATLRLKLKQENNIQEELGIIGEEISRISTMINQMDMFSQTVSHKVALTDINSIIEDIINIYKEPLFSASGTIVTFEPDGALPQIKTSGDAIKQIIINLLKNASEALGDGGTVTVKTESNGSYMKNLATDRDRYSGGIGISIEDNGPGLPEEVMKNLFKPFVTTKDRGHSGLGLSIIHKTVQDLGGAISCTSKPHAGTCFYIRLPIEKFDFKSEE